MTIRFLLNGEPQEVDAPPTTTLLDWLRERRRLTGTKEGCNEGDCGACTVMVTDAEGSRALNACILFLPQLQGRAVRTVEGIAGPEGQMHPVQRAMVEHHGSQCGFCTPGFVVSMAVAHLNGRRDHDDQLAGNLCRCTGYAPIVRAAEAAAAEPVPYWMTEDAGALDLLAQDVMQDGAPDAAAPRSADELAAWYLAHPDATLIAGATDVGLWVTKSLRDLAPVCFLNNVGDVKGIDSENETIRIGAMTTLTDFGAFVADRHPSLAEMIRRYGSVQVRNAATVGGNIANGSPIGDSPPALIALGATLHLRRGDVRRSLPLEDFFLDYGKQDRAPGRVRGGRVLPRPARPPARVQAVETLRPGHLGGLRGVQRDRRGRHRHGGAHRLRRNGGHSETGGACRGGALGQPVDPRDRDGGQGRLRRGLHPAHGHAGVQRLPPGDCGQHAVALLPRNVGAEGLGAGGGGMSVARSPAPRRRAAPRDGGRPLRR
jgi:xanthine dehydrogenase small subunit